MGAPAERTFAPPGPAGTPCSSHRPCPTAGRPRDSPADRLRPRTRNSQEATHVTDPDQSEKTAGGIAGKAIGKAKEALGELTDRDQLAREGRLQQESAKAEAEAKERSAEARAADARAELEQEKAETEAER